MFKKRGILVAFMCCSLLSIGQSVDSVYRQLHIDTSYAYFQFYQDSIGKQLLQHFENTGQEKLVIFHYGGSHIQAERPTTFARQFLQEKYGDGGRGMIFSYGAADTYSSVNYTSTKTGTWDFAKSYKLPPNVPLGVCGMSVETHQAGASLSWDFKTHYPIDNYLVTVFTEIDSNTFEAELTIDGTVFMIDQQRLSAAQNTHAITFSYSGKIDQLTLKTVGTAGTFRFYGLNIEKANSKGIVYHSLGVGAAPMGSVLALSKVEQQAALLQPDIVFLDFGTNDILYHNAINPKLAGQVEKAIKKFRAINPNMLIVLTSTQDLFYKGKSITAGPLFRDLMDSLARKNACLFWNWYDLSGGIKTIKIWEDLGYAKSDYIHLTQNGYEIKGNFIYESFVNTLDKIKAGATSYTVPMKVYTEPVMVSDSSTVDPSISTEKPLPVKKTTPTKKKKYTVKSGDTLSTIARKNHTTVAKIKQANHLKGDMIRTGQVLVIP